MPVALVHPGNESKPEAAPPPPRLKTLRGKRIGLLDISKPGGSYFLDRLADLLRAKYGVAEVVRAKKPTYTKNAPPEVIDQLRSLDAIVEGLAD